MYGSDPHVCEDEFKLSPGTHRMKVESLRDMITQQMGIDVKLEVG